MSKIRTKCTQYVKIISGLIGALWKPTLFLCFPVLFCYWYKWKEKPGKEI